MPHVHYLSECSSAVRLPLTVEEGLPPSRPQAREQCHMDCGKVGQRQNQTPRVEGGKAPGTSLPTSQRKMETASGVQGCALRGWPHGPVTRKGQ